MYRQTNRHVDTLITCGYPHYYDLSIIQVIASLQNLFNKLHWTPLIAVSNGYTTYTVVT